MWSPLAPHRMTPADQLLVTGSPAVSGSPGGWGYGEPVPSEAAEVGAAGGAERRPSSTAATDAAAPRATAPSPHATPFFSMPIAASREIGPGPCSASTASAAMRTALYSQPPFAAQGPFGRCT